MGNVASFPSGLADPLFSHLQQRVLALLFGQPDRAFGTAELIRLAGGGTGANHRFLVRLERAGLVTTSKVGNQKHYRANRKSPIFNELHGLVIKTAGLVEPLRRALEPLVSKIRAAFVYGSVAKGSDTARSDIDLMVISDEVGYHDLFEALQPAEDVLARKINPDVFTAGEWQAKRAEPDSFANRVASRPRIFLIGSDDELS
ncbi:MAG TPA: nucleotidyltransferase domain-containing protein [Thermoanaerobaculia bacterium]|nr:nucleotidyltransferase domain-containing protein [Thermoanaerobaculia bacterium]